MTWNAKLFTKAIIKRKNYRKSISSFEALRPLLSAGLLNFISSASKKSKILEFVCWSDCNILVLFVIYKFIITERLVRIELIDVAVKIV